MFIGIKNTINLAGAAKENFVGFFRVDVNYFLRDKSGDRPLKFSKKTLNLLHLDNPGLQNHFNDILPN